MKEKTQTEQKKKLASQILTLAAPLLVLFIATLAWFIHMTSSQVEQMTFAAKDTGNVMLYHGTVDSTVRDYQKTTLANTVIWGEAIPMEKFSVTIENMLPGQCEYYLLDGGTSQMDVYLKNVVFHDAGGMELSEGTDLPLAQCVGLYLIPLGEAALVGGAELTEQARVTLSLDREESGQLSSAMLRGIPPESAVSPTPAREKYVLAVFCDPVYLQGEGAQPVNELKGSVSFSLAFVTQEKAE